MRKLLILLTMIVAASFALSACDGGNSAQEKGKKADNAYQDAKSSVKKTFNKGPAEKAGKKLDDATDNDDS